MEEFMNMLNPEFFNHVFILLALMIGFTCFKIANCKPFKADGETFSWKELGLGTARNLIVIVGACVVFAVSSICGADLLMIQIGDTKVTLQAAIDLTTLTILAVYGAKYVKNLAEFAGVGEKVGEVKEIAPQTTFNTDPEVYADEEAIG